MSVRDFGRVTTYASMNRAASRDSDFESKVWILLGAIFERTFVARLVRGLSGGGRTNGQKNERLEYRRAGCYYLGTFLPSQPSVE